MSIIISLTQEAIDRGKKAEAGWSPAILNKIEDKKSTKGNSTNYWFEFELTGGPENKEDNKGRFCTFMLNSIGMVNGMAVEDFTNMIAALTDQLPKDIVPSEYDLERLVGNGCWVKVDVKTVDGKIVAQIVDFSRTGDIPF